MTVMIRAFVLWMGWMFPMMSYAVDGVTPAVQQTLERAVETLVPGAPQPVIATTPIADLYEVQVGPYVLYMTGDGQYLLQGQLVDLVNDQNLTDVSKQKRNQALAKQLKDETLIAYPAPNQKAMVTVFTDVDCPYCRQLHQELDRYHAQGIGIQYAAFPRAGVGSDTYNRMVSIWCADDPVQAMDKEKSGQPVTTTACDHPIEDQLVLGQQMGVRGTPAMLLPSGEMVPGKVDASKLAQVLSLKP